MKDPHVGAFGVIGLVLVLLLKAAALASLASAFKSLVSCSQQVWHAGAFCQPACFHSLVPPAWARTLPWAFSVPSLFGAPSFRWGLRSSLACADFILLTGLGAAALVLWLAKSRIGGVTGDVFGMVVEIVETVVLLTFLIG